jgi:hypothetical protein
MHYLRLTPTLLAVLALACPAQTVPAPEATAERASRDERRPEQALSVDLFGKKVELGGSWEYTNERRDHFDLDDTRARPARARARGQARSAHAPGCRHRHAIAFSRAA